MQYEKVIMEERTPPEQKLWRAVLTQAFEDAFGPDRYSKLPKDRMEAQVFLTDYEDNNFKDLCEFSGFDSSFVKRKIKKKLESFSICEERLEHMRNSIKGVNNDR